METVQVSRPVWRGALDAVDPLPMDLRHYGLTTPQGGDPLVSAQYQAAISPANKPGSITLDPSNENLLQLLGVRYFLTTEDQPLFPQLKTNPAFHRMGTQGSYFKVFEFSKPKPPYRWERESPRVAGHTGLPATPVTEPPCVRGC